MGGKQQSKYLLSPANSKKYLLPAVRATFSLHYGTFYQCIGPAGARWGGNRRANICFGMCSPQQIANIRYLLNKTRICWAKVCFLLNKITNKSKYLLNKYWTKQTFSELIANICYFAEQIANLLNKSPICWTKSWFAEQNRSRKDNGIHWFPRPQKMTNILFQNPHWNIIKILKT